MRKPFVGRSELLARALAPLELPGKGLLLQVEGTWGIGKTSLSDELAKRATELADRLESEPAMHVLSVKAETYAPPPHTTHPVQAVHSPWSWLVARPRRHVPRTPSYDEAELQRDFECFARLLDAICASESPATTNRPEAAAGSFRDLTAEIESSRDAVRAVPTRVEVKVRAGRDIRAGDNARIGCVTVPVQKSIESQVDRLHRLFAERLNELGRAAGVVLLIDGIEHLEGRNVGTWLLELLADLEHVDVVVTARIGGSEPERYKDAVERRQLTLFGMDEVRACLEQQLPGAAIGDELVSSVLEFSGGLPLAVAMAADLIRQRTPAGGELCLGELELCDDGPVETLLQAIAVELGESDVANLIRRGRFARRMDVDLAHYLLFDRRFAEGERDQQRRATQALDELRSFSFFEDVDPNCRDGLGDCAFHAYFRARSKSDLHEWEHRSLADFYQARLAAYDESQTSRSGYLCWYKYEQPEWQALMAEWLYHSAQLRDPTTRAEAKLEFVREWLEAFWWWECYEELGFCEKILKDWESSQPESDSGSLGCLREILAAYPKGWRKLDAGDWLAVGRAVTTLRREIRADRPAPIRDAALTSRQVRSAETLRHVRALTSLLLAHSCRFRSGYADLADSRYSEALECMSTDDDPALLAWTLFERADLCMELGDASRAATQLSAAAKCVLDETPEDWELRANLQRLHGDIAAAEGKPREALKAGADALLRAAAFLTSPNETPDPYTVAFYAEQRDRLAERLIGVAPAVGGNECVGLVLDRLGPLVANVRFDRAYAVQVVEAGRASDVADLIAPSPPAVGLAAANDLVLIGSPRALVAVRKDGADDGLVAAQVH